MSHFLYKYADAVKSNLSLCKIDDDSFDIAKRVLSKIIKENIDKTTEIDINARLCYISLIMNNLNLAKSFAEESNNKYKKIIDFIYLRYYYFQQFEGI